MNYSNLIRIAGKALLRNRLRAILTMLGVIIGVASVIAMLAIGEGSKRSIQSQMSSMGTNLISVMPWSQRKGGVMFGGANTQTMKLSDVDALRKEVSAITSISPEVRSNGQLVYGDQNWPTSVYGGNEDYFTIRKISLKSGRFFTNREVRSLSKVCVMGQTVVNNLFGEDADPIGLTVRFRNIPLQIIGVMNKRGETSWGQDQDDMIIAPYTTVQKRILAIDYIQGIVMSAVSEDRTEEAIDNIETVLRLQHKIKDIDDEDFRVMSQSELVSTFTSVSNILTTLLGIIAGISLLVGGIGIMNIMYVSVTERTKEIGLRMSVGGRGIDILMQFLIESVLLSVSGGVIGILLGYIAANVVGSLMSWPIVIMPNAVILSFVVCSVIGIFFGWYPARKASNLNPIDAIRYE